MIAPFGPPPGFTISWSYPNPAAIPLMSILKLEAGWSVSAFRVKTAVLFPPFPGARFPPALTVTRALIWAVEFPPSVPLLLTVTLSSPSAGARSVVHEKGPTVHDCSTGVGIVPGNS